MEDLMLDLETEKEELRNEVESTKADLEVAVWRFVFLDDRASCGEYSSNLPNPL